MLSKAEFVGVGYVPLRSFCPMHETWDDAVVKAPGLCLMRESPLIKTHGKKKDAEKKIFNLFFFFFLNSIFFYVSNLKIFDGIFIERANLNFRFGAKIQEKNELVLLSATFSYLKLN